eukprot:4770054-Pleurochrysis_carterae.AAC.1
MGCSGGGRVPGSGWAVVEVVVVVVVVVFGLVVAVVAVVRLMAVVVLLASSSVVISAMDWGRGADRLVAQGGGRAKAGCEERGEACVSLACGVPLGDLVPARAWRRCAVDRGDWWPGRLGG